MPKSLSQIQAAIDKLQKEAEALKAKEVVGVVGRIQVAIKHYGLTAADLFPNVDKPVRRGRPPAKVADVEAKVPKGDGKRKPVSVKYKDASGNTWTGRGSTPRWLTAAIAEGKQAEDFLVSAP